MSSFQVMLKPRGPVCNLRCAYCYYLPKEGLYPAGSFRMSDALLEEFTRQYIAAQSVPEVVFAWQGGEPTLMGLDFFVRAVELQARYGRPGMRIVNAIQTNAVALDDAWCRFFREHGFLVGVSLDGWAELHDLYRRDGAGQPTFERVMAGLALLRRHGVEHNILTAVHAGNVGHGREVYRFLRDAAGATYIQFIPIVDPGAASWSVRGSDYGCFLSAVFDEWVRRDVGRVFVQLFDACLGAWAGGRAGLCVHEETCGAALVMEHNGDVYACDHFVRPEYLLGNITSTPLEELAASSRQARFGQDKSATLPAQCHACDVAFICRGGCPKDRLDCDAAGEPGLNRLCAGYREFFQHIDRPMRLMAAEWRAGRAPANVMLHVLREEAERERRFAVARPNDPCPCGSGRKFKRCHGSR